MRIASPVVPETAGPAGDCARKEHIEPQGKSLVRIAPGFAATSAHNDLARSQKVQ
jgi:hypothetical protein